MSLSELAASLAVPDDIDTTSSRAATVGHDAVPIDLIEYGPCHVEARHVPPGGDGPRMPVEAGAARGTLPAYGPPGSPGGFETHVDSFLADEVFDLAPLTIHSAAATRSAWPCTVEPAELAGLPFPTPAETTLEMVSDFITGGEPYRHVERATGNAGSDASNSSSLGRRLGSVAADWERRAPYRASLPGLVKVVAVQGSLCSVAHGDFTRGTNAQIPFRPGGLDPTVQRRRNDGKSATRKGNRLAQFAELIAGGVRKTPPGFDEGVDFGEPAVEADTDVGSIVESQIADHAAMDGVDTVAVITAPVIDSSIDTELDHVIASAPSAGIGADGYRGSPRTEERAWAISDDAHVDDFAEAVPHMARQWPFELDQFQKRAVLHLERHESVFVAAHTSAGKTVVAEYAIALTAKHMTRCIYTSPIKALSNQKFRDFHKQGIDVGLLTGDIQLRPEASCMIMTTEILRSMLYRGADMIRDVEWVIFDEVHYVNDSERGVVWEEVIIMLPDHVNLILLSATVPNTFEFADWVGRTKQKNIYVISTTHRPVPLEHYLYTGTNGKTADELFKIVDAKGTFLTHGYRKAVAAKKSRMSERDKSFGARGKQNISAAAEKGLYVSLVKKLDKLELRPCVIFTFSKRRCESNADALSGIDLTTTTEKSETQVFMDQSIARLKGTDRSLPQVLRMREMLRRGVGVHHGGLLPIIKEMVEILFGRGLVKILFATETFAMGVNMPARCVVFDTTRKHDGNAFRDLLAGEYTQMAGRAGRRGLDKTGTVILLAKADIPESSDLHRMMLGKPTRLDSKFRLTYNMILNLLRVEELRVEDMLRRSFAEDHTRKTAASDEAQLQRAKGELAALDHGTCDHCGEEMEQYYRDNVEILRLSRVVQASILSFSSKFLSAGRVVVLNSLTYRNVLAVIVRSEAPGQARGGQVSSRRFSVLFAQSTADNHGQRVAGDDVTAAPLPVLRLSVPQGRIEAVTAVVDSTDLARVTAHKLRINERAILDPRDRDSAIMQHEVVQQLRQLAEANINGITCLDPIADMKIKDFAVVEAWSQMLALEQRVRTSSVVRCPTLDECYARAHSSNSLDEMIARLNFKLSEDSLRLLPEYEQRIGVLKELRYIDENCAVQLKGRVACEITTCDELIATELVFENVLTPLEPAEIVALLSALVFQEKVDIEPRLTSVLLKGVENIKEIATRVAEVQLGNGMDSPTDEYIRTLHFGLVEVVYAWAQGVPFRDITDLTDVLEGSIVRCIVRLDETCRDVRNAAKVIGDPVLYQKMDEASSMIKRDVIFAASLYT